MRVKTEECESRGRKVRQGRDMGVVWVQGNPWRWGKGRRERASCFQSKRQELEWSEDLRRLFTEYPVGRE